MAPRPSSGAAATDDLSAILDRLLGLHPKDIDLSLGRLRRVLAALGHPERRLPPVIHVAGTNGKGSTVAFMRAMLEADGRRVHVYTSPHLVRFNERIRLGAIGGGRLVEDDPLIEALVEVERANAGELLTFFEATTAAAFLLFAAHPADTLLLEVGLGGRFDATNVVDRPIATAITSVSIDHAKFLGDKIPGIAREKAGILKRGVPAVVARQSDEAMGAIERVAARVAAPLLVSGQDWHAHEERGRLVFQDDDGLLDLPLPKLVGRHQYENAGAAIACLRSLGADMPPDRAIEAGLQNVVWPARLQKLTGGRLLQHAPEHAEIWLDGGHNPDGGRAVADTMVEFEERRPRPLVLLVGMLNTKDAAGFLANFAGLARRVFAVPIRHSEAARPAEEIAATARALGFLAEAARSVPSALEAVAALRFEAPPRVLICGSLYLAGEVLAENGTPPE